MSRTRSRSFVLPAEEELRLPRPPGIIRRFWSRHPVLADALIALLFLFLSAAPGTVLRTSTTSGVTRSETQLITSNIVLTVIIVLSCALLLRRRQWPVIAAVGAYAVSVATLFSAAPTGSGPLLLITGYGVAVYRSTRAAWVVFGVGIGVISLFAWALSGSLLDVQTAVNGIAGAVVLALIGTLIGANVGGRKRYLEAIIDRSRQLLVERDQQATIAAAAERSRIAREMHDIVSHSLTVIVALSEGAAATADPSRAKDASSAAAATARGALTEMRAMLGVLREGDTAAPLTPVEPVSPQVTVAAAQRAGFPVVLTTRGDGEAAPAVEFAIGRIVQEGVTNAMRHAPGATGIDVRIDRSEERIIVTIDNDGASATGRGDGFGLRGLAERAAHVGGSVTSGPAGHGRWSLRAELPHTTDAAASSTDTEDTP
ncbi:sensor histidine kinase [Microbacterium sp. NPDC055903]